MSEPSGASDVLIVEGEAPELFEGFRATPPGLRGAAMRASTTVQESRKGIELGVSGYRTGRSRVMIASAMGLNLPRPGVLVPLVFFGAHTALVVEMARSNLRVEHPAETWMIFALLDWPAYWLAGGEPGVVHEGSAPVYEWLTAAWFGLVGGAQWGMIGALVGWAIENVRDPEARRWTDRSLLAAWGRLAAVAAIVVVAVLSLGRSAVAAAIDRARWDRTAVHVQWVADELATHVEGGGTVPSSIATYFLEVHGTDNTSLAHDAWGGALRLEAQGASGEPVRVTSFGRDGVPGGSGPDADITR